MQINKVLTYSTYKRSPKFLGIIDYKILIIVSIYLMIVLNILKIIPLNYEIKIYITCILIVPLILLILTNINNLNAYEAILIIIKYLFVKKEYTNLAYLNNSDELKEYTILKR